MNSKRIDGDLPKEHDIKITLDWLLGFVEGDGSHYNVTNLIYSVGGNIVTESNGFISNGTIPSGIRYYSSEASKRGTRKFSSIKSEEKLDPWFLTGFTDAEGYFSLIVGKNSKSVLGYHTKLSFNVGLHNKDLELLKLIVAHFKEAGNITKLGE